MSEDILMRATLIQEISLPQILQDGMEQIGVN